MVHAIWNSNSNNEGNQIFAPFSTLVNRSGHEIKCCNQHDIMEYFIINWI